LPGHSGENQFSTLLPVLQDYGIIHKLGAIIADNASSNNVLCRTIENYMEKEANQDWSACNWRMRYIGHIINLVVQAFLFTNIMAMDELELYDDQDKNGDVTDEEARRAKFRLLGPLGQAHNIVVYMRGSPARTKVFKELAERMIPMDNCTRWNSWCLMLVVMLTLKSQVEKYCDLYEDELQRDLLSREDWKKLEMIKDFLAPFVRATLATKGDHASIDRTLFNMDILI
jgi:hypothetical protein